ncbi:MAG: OST-HTH/LOTUS domain-containing protein, partial [Aeromicrobium sp.]
GPNIDMTLSALIGHKPDPATRPRFGSIARWLCAKVPAGGIVEACVLTNVAPDAADRMQPWINAVRTHGFAVFAKPKLHPDDDIDAAMIEHLHQRQVEGGLTEVIVASHDFAAFEEPLASAAEAGVSVLMMGFNEYAAGAIRSDEITFVDLEDVPGTFGSPLPRADLTSLPPEGRWFEPLVRLSPTIVSLDDVAEFLSALTAQSDDPIRLARVGSLLREELPRFDHRRFGYEGLMDLVTALAESAPFEVVTDAGHPALRGC